MLFLVLFIDFFFQNLMEYGPGYELGVAVGNKRDFNTQSYLQGIYSDILCKC